MNSNFKLQIEILIATTLLLSSCGKMNSTTNANSESATQNTNDTPTALPTEPLAWESANHPERVAWSRFVLQLINEDFETFSKAADITTFCPTYNSLPKPQKLLAWGNLIAGIAKYESAWDPISRMQESSFSEPDQITHQPVFSEGLLQLSYGDILWADWCQFNWTADQHLSPTDPRKSILDPFINLRCGIGILARQIERRGAIVLPSGVYWAVIKSGGSYQKINEIAQITQRLTFCKPDDSTAQ